MYYGKIIRRVVPQCLECGEEITYGRADKKFCCDECKNRYNNQAARFSRSVRRKVQAALDNNYEILDALVKSGIDAVDMAEVVALGFRPDYFTSGNRTGRSFRVCCYDISYAMTPARLSSISKLQNLSLTLRSVCLDDVED